MTNRQKQAINTKNKLERCGIELISQRGVDGFSIEDLTSACSVSKGTFYHYFKDKDAFVLHLTWSSFDNLKARLMELTDLSAMERLRYFVLEHTKILFDIHGLARQYYISALGNEDHMSDGQRKMDYDISLISDILLSGVQNGEFTDKLPLRELSTCIFVVLCGRSLYWLLHEKTCDVMQLAETLYATFIRPSVEVYLSHP